jgi:hypothetical protein
MAWLRQVPPLARHPRDRWQVRYRDDTDQERSAGIYPTQPAANAVKRRLDRGESIQSIRGLAEETGDQRKALTLFGDYVTNTWWPRWRDGHPHSAYLYGKRIEKRILPAFGNLRFVDLDADLIGDWKAKMIAEELAPQTINAYVQLDEQVDHAGLVGWAVGGLLDQRVEFGVGVQDGLALGPGGLVERSWSGEQVLHVEGREPDRHLLPPPKQASAPDRTRPRAEEHAHNPIRRPCHDPNWCRWQSGRRRQRMGVERGVQDRVGAAVSTCRRNDGGLNLTTHHLAMSSVAAG